MPHTLPLVGSVDFPSQLAATKLNSGSPACSPTVDLVATIPETSNGERVDVWRTNGQVVHKINLRYHRLAQVICWKPDGQFLAVAWDDGFVRLVGLENSKAAYQIRIADGDDVSVCHMAWALNHTMGTTTSARWRAPNAVDALPGARGQKRDRPNLPRAIAFLEVETALPRISPLPMDGGAGEDMFVFTTKSSLDFIFPPAKPERDDLVDVLVVGTSDGRIHLTVYDSFVIGSFDYSPPASLKIPGPLSLVRHSFHPDISKHMLLFGPSTTEHHALLLVPMTLGFLTSSPIDLSLLASKTTSLHNLIRYLRQTQIHMFQQWQSTRDLPGRFLRPLKQDLERSGKAKDIMTAICHSVLTGHMFPAVREWLTEIVAERGHKRWDKSVSEGLLSLRSLIHENFLPAVERTAIALSRLHGLARFHDTAPGGIGFTEDNTSLLLDVVAGLSLIGNKLLPIVMKELDLFTAFSSWMHFEITRQASSGGTDDLVEKEAQVKYAKVLAYVRKYLDVSPMAEFLEQGTKAQQAATLCALMASEDGLMKMLEEHLARPNQVEEDLKALPQVKFLVDLLNDRAKDMFRNIAEAQKREVRFGPATRIDIDGSVSKLDIKMQPVSQGSTDAMVFTAINTNKRPEEILIYKSVYSVSDKGNEVTDITTITKTQSTGISLSGCGGGKILDLKFLDDKTLFVLWKNHDQSSSIADTVDNRPPSRPPVLLQIPYTSPDLKYLEHKPGPPVIPHKVEGDLEHVCQAFKALVLVDEGGDDDDENDDEEQKFPSQDFEPCSMEIKLGGEWRGKIPTRVCLLEKDRFRYRVYALSSDGDGEEEEAFWISGKGEQGHGRTR